MKESTKNRLKKVGKVSLYCLGLGFALLSGLVVGKCSADNANRSSSGESSSLSPTHHVLHLEGESISCSDSPSLRVKRALEGVTDYLTFGNVYRGYNVVAPSSIGIQANPEFSFTTIPLSALSNNVTYYCLLSDSTSGHNWGYCALEVNTWVSQGRTGTFPSDMLDWKENTGVTSDLFYFKFTTQEAFMQFVCIRTWDNVYPIGVYTEDDWYKSVAPSVASIDLGEYYNPLPMVGQTINDASIIVYNSSIPETNFFNIDFVRSSSNDFVFVSSGKVFDGFRVELSRVMNLDGSQIERYATKSGDTIIAPPMSVNYVTANAFYYRLKSSQVWVKVWELPYNGTDQGYNYWSYNGRWLSSSFRYIEVKVDGGATGFSSWLPTFTLSDLLALNVWTAGALVLGDSYNNVFTMLGKGFESVGGILTIQILPYLSLGTLIFVPLIVLIIFAILRILNK